MTLRVIHALLLEHSSEPCSDTEDERRQRAGSRHVDVATALNVRTFSVRAPCLRCVLPVPPRPPFAAMQ